MTARTASKSFSPDKSVDRRGFMALSSAALVTAGLASHTVAASIRTSKDNICPPDLLLPRTTQDRDIEVELDLIKQSQLYLERAEKEAESIYNDWPGFTKVWEEGRSLHMQGAQYYYDKNFYLYEALDQELELPSLQYIDPNLAPLPTAEEFLEEELRILKIVMQVNYGIDTGTLLKGAPQPGPADTIISKVFTALGIGAEAAALVAILRADGWFRRELWSSLSRSARSIRQLLTYLTSSAFSTRVRQRLGQAALARIAGRIAARAVPFVGTALLAGNIIWAIGNQIDFFA